MVVATDAIDALFTRLGGQGDSTAPPPPIVSESSPIPTEVDAPPAINDPADVQVAYEWLRRERKRLDAYTSAQLARLRSEHEALVRQNYNNEQMLIVKSQELSRKEECLTAQSRTIQQQGLELSQREQALAGQLQEWCKAQEGLDTVRQETEVHQSMLAALATETAALQKTREEARADLEALAVALEQQREARARDEALYRARQAELEKRLEDADRAETVARQRMAEFDAVEERMLREMEDQEKQMAAERREFAALQSRLNQENFATRRAEIEEMTAELDQLRIDLLEWSQDLDHREAELAQGQDRLHREIEARNERERSETRQPRLSLDPLGNRFNQESTGAIPEEKRGWPRPRSSPRHQP
jgi:chromosome segregation ATPase